MHRIRPAAYFVACNAPTLESPETSPMIRRELAPFVWHVGAFVLLVLAPAQIRLGRPLWDLSASAIPQALAVGIAYLTAALWMSVTNKDSRPSIPRLFTALLVGYGAAVLLLLSLPGVPYSRALLLISLALSIALLILPTSPTILRGPLSTSPLIAAGLLALYGWYGSRAAQPEGETAPAERTVTTALAPVGVTILGGDLLNTGPEDGNGGGFTQYQDGLLLLTGRGRLLHLVWHEGERLDVVDLPLAVPLNTTVFLEDFTQASSVPFLRTTGIVVNTLASPDIAYVAHQYWNHEGQCFTIRVSRIALPVLRSGMAEPAAGWETVFESKPCLPFSEDFNTFDTYESGGRLAWDSENSLLLTLGDFGRNGLVVPALSQLGEADYGKVLRLEAGGGKSILTIGHRNPQGLLVDRRGRIWETEHGPQGGDELNLLREGLNYGWPWATYGTDYDRFDWPLSSEGTNHGKFTEPALAFVPSVGITNLIELDSLPIPEWRGDLLMASLRAMTLYRVRLRDERVIYTEPIFIGQRIRDLAQEPGGRIVLWTDEGDLLVLSRGLARDALDPSLARCVTCHASEADASALAPSLRGIVGRPVASEPEFAYSAAIRRLGGVWTEDRLSDFLQDPDGFAPGTRMKEGQVADSALRRGIIEALTRHQ